jgi:hypothetical protein
MGHAFRKRHISSTMGRTPMTTRLLTCGFVNGFDRRGTLSRSPETIDARGQADQRWPRLLLFSVIVFISFMLSLDMSHARPAKDPMNYKLYAHNLLQDWDQFICLVELYERESNWSPIAKNGSHHGIPQGRSTYLAKVGYKKQIQWGLKYIEARHQTPCQALHHFKTKGWH